MKDINNLSKKEFGINMIKMEVTFCQLKFTDVELDILYDFFKNWRPAAFKYAITEVIKNIERLPKRENVVKMIRNFGLMMQIRFTRDQLTKEMGIYTFDANETYEDHPIEWYRKKIKEQKNESNN